MRSRIVDVSLELFARRGIDGVSIAEVAMAAGVSKANVMHHFGTKRGLYAACLDVIDGHLQQVVDRVMPGDDPVADLARSLEVWSANHPVDCRVMAYGLLRFPEQPGRWALEAPVERMVDLVAGTGVDPDAATAVVVDLLGRVIYREMARPITEARAARAQTSKTQQEQ